MRPRRIFLFLILALLCGVVMALYLKLPSGRQPLSTVPAEDKPPAVTSPAKTPAEAPGEKSSRPRVPDLTGLAVGSGQVGVEVPSSGDGAALMKRELEAEKNAAGSGEYWPRTSGKIKEVEDQLKEIRDDVNEATLDAVTRSLNALPFVSADPEEAKWHVSGSKIELEITIPAEDIKIGNP